MESTAWKSSISRRVFLGSLPFSAALVPRAMGNTRDAPNASFFVVGDTHYCARQDDPAQMLEESLSMNQALLRWLNELPGREFPSVLGGGKIPVPAGVIHAGDVIDNGDKGPGKYDMVATECAAFTRDWGLNGGEGILRWPVREIHGNHDGPQGDTPMIREIIARNQRRKGLLHVSKNGLHYSWDWGGVHFVALGIVVGDAPQVKRKRRYAPMASLPFLQQDLALHVGDSGKPVVLIHHVDVHRYSSTVEDEKVKNHEWDYGDAQAFYQTIAPYRIAACICGHTHVRRTMRWDGTSDVNTTKGVPFLNTDNAAHFHSQNQAILHVSITSGEMMVREFSTKDAWKSGDWTPQQWRYTL
ncbi:MAG: metallophosphoesterase [Akkermansiaceae bacterium]